MGKATRALTMAGLALVAGATLGAGSASAAAPSSASVQGAQSTTTVANKNDRDRVVGFYSSRRACEWAGERGERRDRWDDFYCSPDRRGGFRRAWVLTAQYNGWDNHGGHGNWGGHDGGNWGGHRGGWNNR